MKIANASGNGRTTADVIVNNLVLGVIGNHTVSRDDLAEAFEAAAKKLRAEPLDASQEEIFANVPA